MRLAKALGLAAIAALVTMALLGASSASAEKPTVLCLQHTSLVCPEGLRVTSDHLELATGTVAKVLSNLATILCLYWLELNEPLELGTPQLLHGKGLIKAGCGTTSTHTNCEITTEELPLWDLLKTGLDSGVEIALSGVLHLTCAEVGIFKVKVDCKYSMSGLELAVGGGHVTANKTPVSVIEGSFFCPQETKLDYLLETLEPSYVLE